MIVAKGTEKERELKLSNWSFFLFSTVFLEVQRKQNWKEMVRAEINEKN